MSITIDNPTAEAIFAEIKRQIPSHEFERLKLLFNMEEGSMGAPTFGIDWSEEDLRDLDQATARLIDERFGPEEGFYD